MKRHSFIRAAACLVAAVATSTAVRAEDALVSCRTAGARYVEAIATGDPEKVAATFTASGLVNAPEGIFPGQAAIVAFDRAFVMPGIRQTVTPTHAETLGESVLCAGTYVVSFAPGFPMKQVGGNYTALLVRSRGGWEHAMLTYNYTPPPMPQQSQ